MYELQGTEGGGPPDISPVKMAGPVADLRDQREGSFTSSASNRSSSEDLAGGAGGPPVLHPETDEGSYMAESGGSEEMDESLTGQSLQLSQLLTDSYRVH